MQNEGKIAVKGEGKGKNIGPVAGGRERQNAHRHLIRKASRYALIYFKTRNGAKREVGQR